MIVKTLIRSNMRVKAFIVYFNFKLPLFLEKSGVPPSRDQAIEIFKILKTKNSRLPKNHLKMPVRSLKELNSSRSFYYMFKSLIRDLNSNFFPFHQVGTDVNSLSFPETEIFRMPRKANFYSGLFAASET